MNTSVRRRAQRQNLGKPGVNYATLPLTPVGNLVVHPARVQDDRLRITVLGGNEQVGRNMTMLEYGEDIILIDMGIQFADEDTRGIDGIVPDISCLKGREHQVRAVIITHLHADHIGAIPYLLPQLPGVPVFSAPMTIAMIAKKLQYTPEVTADLRAVDEHSVLTLGNFTARFFGVTHSAPSALAIALATPCGTVVHTGDFKIDFQPTDAQGKKNLAALTALKEQKILALLSDSTNANRSGKQSMERTTQQDLDTLVRTATGRVFFGIISTNVDRMQEIVRIAERYGRHVALGGLSTKTMIEVAQQVGYLTARPGTFIDVEDIAGLPDHKVVGIFPGAQGETNAAFYRLAHNTLRGVRVQPGDTVVFSSSVIPGNERSTQYIEDAFYRLGARVVNSRELNIHAGGHAKAEDLGAVVQLVQPKYLVPIEGNHSFLHHHAKSAVAAGFARERIFIADNGQVMEFTRDGVGKLTQHRIPLTPIIVDGTTLGAVDAGILHERKRMGDEGIVLVTASVRDGLFVHARVEFLGFLRGAHLADLRKKILETLQRTSPGQQDLAKRIEEMIAREIDMTPLVALLIAPV